MQYSCQIGFVVNHFLPVVCMHTDDNVSLYMISFIERFIYLFIYTVMFSLTQSYQHEDLSIYRLGSIKLLYYAGI